MAEEAGQDSARLSAEQYQALMADFVSDGGVLTMVAEMTREEIEALPPFPFPRELFPPGTFPPEMRFSCNGVDALPEPMARTMEAHGINLTPKSSIIITTRTGSTKRWPSLRRWLVPGFLRRSGGSNHDLPPQLQAAPAATAALSAPPALSAAPAAPASPAPPAPPPSLPVVPFGIRSITVPEDMDSDWPELHRAAKAGDVASLEWLLASSAVTVDLRDAAGETALQVAVAEGKATCAVQLLEAGADPHLVNERLTHTIGAGWCAVHSAAQSERTEGLALLLERHASVHAPTRKRVTPLHVAAFNGRLPATKLLVARGACLDALDEDGHTPLANAQHRMVDCPCRTAEQQADWSAVIAFLQKVAPMGEVARREAAERSWQLHVASILIEAAESDTPLARRQLTTLLACYKQDVNAQDFDGCTALHAAAEAGHVEAVALLLEARADARVANNYRDSPLHFAAREGRLGVARLLLDWGADAGARNQFGVDALAQARRSHVCDNACEREAVSELLAVAHAAGQQSLEAPPLVCK